MVWIVCDQKLGENGFELWFLSVSGRALWTPRCLMGTRGGNEKALQMLGAGVSSDRRLQKLVYRLAP